MRTDYDETARARIGRAASRMARTPEELESLLEDALITEDVERLTDLFEDEALLVADDTTEVRSPSGIAAAMTLWNLRFVAGARQVLQVGDIALTVGNGVNVLRRGRDRSWRLAIALIETNYYAKENEA